MQHIDTILKNGKVLSVDSKDNVISGSAVSIRDGKIVEIGESQEILKSASSNTQIIDCGGNTILPGMCDAHCHASWSASSYLGCDLFNVHVGDEFETMEDVIDEYMLRLKKYVEEHPELEIIRGVGWVPANFTGSAGEVRMPTRHDIDKICSDKPVVLESFCQHFAWVNTKAMEGSGLDENTPDPAAGEIHRESDNHPEGVLVEAEAINIVKHNLDGYDFTVEQYKEVIKYYQKNLANIYGITHIYDALHSDNARIAYKELAENNELTIRVRGSYFLEKVEDKNQKQEILDSKGKDDVNDLFGIHTLKLFLESELTTCEPYEQEVIKANGYPDGYNGHLTWKDDDVIDYMTKAQDVGLNIHIHAMGDASVKQSTKCLIESQKRTKAPQRNAIAHIMLIKDEDIKDMGANNIVASCQPRWMVYDTDVADFYTPFFGEKRAKSVYPNKSLLDAGCIVAYGTDFPVTPPPNPFHEIQCAMTRSVFKDAPDYERFNGEILAPQEQVGLNDAIKSLTWSGAYQNNIDDIAGSIEPGKSADLVILNCDIEALPVEEIYDILVEKTLFKGNVVYER